MKAARFHAPGDIRIEDVPEPVAGPGEVTVAIGIAAAGDGQVEVLAELASILLDPDRARALREAASPEEVVELLRPRPEEDG